MSEILIYVSHLLFLCVENVCKKYIHKMLFYFYINKNNLYQQKQSKVGKYEVIKFIIVILIL